MVGTAGHTGGAARPAEAQAVSAGVVPPGGGAPRGRPAASRRRALGAYGERVAARYLTGLGMAVVARNWRCRDGEIDIVALDGDVVVVCEVKTRSGTAFEHPLAAVTPAKAKRLGRLAQRWAGPGRDVRVDLVAVVHRGRGAAEVQHVRGVC